MSNTRLIAVVQVMETRKGLRKGDLASCKPVGDGLVKIKLDPDGNAFEQIKWLYHEWTHLILNVFRARKRGRTIKEKEEEEICNKVENATARIFRREFRSRKEKK